MNFFNLILDKIECERRREEQEAERKEWEEQNAENEDGNDDKEGEGEEEKKWEEIVEKDFVASEQKYVVCLDTTGQDRPFTEEQVSFAVQIVKEYGQNWHQTEKLNLGKDITDKVETGKKDREYNENEGPNLLNDEDKYIDDLLASREDLETDEQRDREAKYYRLKFLTTQLTGLTTEPEVIEEDEKSKDSKPPTAKGKSRKDVSTPKDEPKEEAEGEGEDEPPVPLEPRLDEGNRRWRDEIVHLKEAKLVRFPKVFQSIFYLLKYFRENI